MGKQQQTGAKISQVPPLHQTWASNHKQEQKNHQVPALHQTWASNHKQEQKITKSLHCITHVQKIN